MNHTDMQAFNTVCENIDKTKPVKTRRLGLLFTTLSRRKARAAIERMEFDPKTEQHLKDGVDEIVNLTFLNDGKTFKRYLFEHGLERYEYLHNLSKAMRIVYDQPAVKIESRNYMMKEIRNNKEPVLWKIWSSTPTISWRPGSSIPQRERKNCWILSSP